MKIGKTKYLVELSALIAIMLALELTNIGMIKLGLIEITILHIPVVIGAMVMGPTAGAILGGTFGLISFWECFGKSVFGSALLMINPLYTFIICFVGRVLMGLLCGLIFKAIYKVARPVSYYVAGLAGALLNTLFFVVFLFLLFGNHTLMLGDFPYHIEPSLTFAIAFVGLNGVVEAIVCCIVGGAVGNALAKIK